MVEHLEELGTGLVDGADDGAAALRQRLEQRQTLEARRAVQTAVITRQHTALRQRHIHTYTNTGSYTNTANYVGVFKFNRQRFFYSCDLHVKRKNVNLCVSALYKNSCGFCVA